VIVRAVKQSRAELLRAAVDCGILSALLTSKGRRAPLPAARLHKNLAMIIAAVLAITLDPALVLCLSAYGFHSDRCGSTRRQRGPVAASARKSRTRSAVSSWRSTARGAWSLQHPFLVIADRSSSWRPPCRSTPGSLPSSCRRSRKAAPLHAYNHPGISITEAQKLLQVTDRVIAVPEVERVLGKPAGLRPRPTRRRSRCSKRSLRSSPRASGAGGHLVFRLGPDWLKRVLRRITPTTSRSTS